MFRFSRWWSVVSNVYIFCVFRFHALSFEVCQHSYDWDLTERVLSKSPSRGVPQESSCTNRQLVCGMFTPTVHLSWHETQLVDMAGVGSFWTPLGHAACCEVVVQLKYQEEAELPRVRRNELLEWPIPFAMTRMSLCGSVGIRSRIAGRCHSTTPSLFYWTLHPFSICEQFLLWHFFISIHFMWLKSKAFQKCHSSFVLRSHCCLKGTSVLCGLGFEWMADVLTGESFASLMLSRFAEEHQRWLPFFWEQTWHEARAWDALAVMGAIETRIVSLLLSFASCTLFSFLLSLSLSQRNTLRDIIGVFAPQGPGQPLWCWSPFFWHSCQLWI